MAEARTNSDGPSTVHWLDRPEPIAIDSIKSNSFGLLVLTGIVNPLGPTLSGLALLSEESAGKGFLVKFFLNPFSSAAEAIAQFTTIPPREILVAEAIKRVGRLGYDDTGCFTLLCRGDRLMDTQTHRLLAAALLSRTEGVARKLPFLKRYPNNPWDRVRAEIDELGQSARPRTLRARLGFGAANPTNRNPTPAELKEFMDIILHDDHRGEEEKAFFAAWDGAVTHNPAAGTSGSVMEVVAMAEFYATLMHLDETREKPGSTSDQPTWRPQMHEDSQAWAQLVYQPKLEDRIRGYRTRADELFGEIIRYATLGDQSSVAHLSRIYQQMLGRGMPVEIRRQIYQETASAQQSEPAVVSYNAYLPFIFCEAADGIVGSATVDFISVGELIDGDPMTRVKEVIGLIERKSLRNRGAAFGALLFTGDSRVSRLLLPLRDQLTENEVTIAMRGSTSLISAASVEFLIAWLEGMDANSTDGLFGTVASGLVNVRRRAESPVVMTGRRPFPVGSVTREEQARMGRFIPIDKFTAQITSRLLNLERTEPEPKIMPVVLETWGISLSGTGGARSRSKTARKH